MSMRSDVRVLHRPQYSPQVALYSFTSNNEQELSFEKGDRLEIIERPPSDPEWYRARDSRGHVGLVPRNYLQELADYLTTPYRYHQHCFFRILLNSFIGELNKC